MMTPDEAKKYAEDWVRWVHFGILPDGSKPKTNFKTRRLTDDEWRSVAQYSFYFGLHKMSRIGIAFRRVHLGWLYYGLTNAWSKVKFKAKKLWRYLNKKVGVNPTYTYQEWCDYWSK